MILKNKKYLGILQGRLTKQKKKIQQFPNENWKNEFKLIYQLKLNYLEWTIDNYGFYKNPINLKNKHKQILNLCKQYKIKVNSITADFFMEKPFWNYKNDYYYINKIKKLIDNCSLLKIKFIILPLVDNSSIKNLKQERVIINKLKTLDSILINKKVQILFESDYDPRNLLRFIKSFDHNLYGINYDLGNSASLGYSIEKEFSFYGKYIKNIHLKDRLKNGPSVKFGNGNAKFRELFNQLKKINYKGTLIFQSARPMIKGNDLNEIKINLKYLDKFISN